MDRTPSKPSKLQRTGLLLKNLLIASLAYASVVEVIHVYRTGTLHPFARGPKSVPVVVKESGSLSGGVNWRLRPDTLVENIEDAFLGARPDVDTYANYTRLIEVCTGSKTKLENMRNVHDCLQYLTEKEDDYYFTPEHRPSLSDSKYPSKDNAAPHTEKYIGECPGPIQLYHTYWTGPSTWRVELFIKAYLYTQNIPCSRLYIWLDSDNRNANALTKMMEDPGFERFLPLVERGDITLKAWNFPSKIPLPKGSVAQDPIYAKYFTDDGKLRRGDDNKNSKGQVYLGDGVVREQDGSEWLVLTERQMTFLPVAVSDAVRFVVLHLYGGVYLDMDILLLRDLRPLLLPPDSNFAERWAVHSHPGDYNTAVMALSPNSSLSSYLVRGGVRMGLNFHPRIIGRMAWKDGRVEELAMFETGLFDPIWGEFNWGREGRCTVPCFKDYGMAFDGNKDAIKNEWESYDGKQLPEKSIAQLGDDELRKRDPESEKIPAKGQATQIDPTKDHEEVNEAEFEQEKKEALAALKPQKSKDSTYGGRAYKFEDDKYPPNNRTLENFFRGAYSYHIHNQVCVPNRFFKQVGAVLTPLSLVAQTPPAELLV